MNKGGRAAVARSRSIDHQLDEERERRGKEVQILILGGPGAGKTTFLKQLRLHYGDHFPQSERRRFHDRILQNVATSLVMMMEAMEKMDLQFATLGTQKLAHDFKKRHPRVSILALINKLKEADAKAEKMCPGMTKAELSRQVSTIDIYNPEVPRADDMQTLWADSALQTCFSKRPKLDNLACTSDYFLQHIGRICSPDYLASIQDILHIRWPTLGVQEHIFTVDNLLYRMIDVAGQKSLRKKWIHFFDGVTAVVFFVSLAGFDEMLEEDPTVNTLIDSLQAFNDLSHNRFLDKTDFILFLNKTDLFQVKLKTSSISSCFPEYKGTNSLEDSLKYVKGKFMQSKPAHKQCYTHTCCAIDVPFMKDLLATVVDCILDINVKRSRTI